jgi:hypothetical protein
MADSSTSNGPHSQLPLPNPPSPLLLLSNMSNLMSIKLDSVNYIVWKLQLTTILEAYSMIDHIDGSIPKPSQHLIDADGNFTTAANPSFLSWKKRDKALLTLIYSTLSPPVLSMVVGLNSALEVWNTLEQRFTSTARANVLNLKLELQSVKKGNDSINAYMQRVKTARDKLSAVGVQIDDEEMLHMILKGLPKEYSSFNSAIRTRDDSLTFEKLSVLLQTEELSINESSDMNTTLAMFVSNTNRHNGGNSNFHRGRGRNSYSNRGRGGGRYGNSYPQSQNQYSQNQFSQGSQGSQPTFNGQNPNSFNKPEHNRPVCQICGKVGHYAIDCYHRMDFAYQGKNPPTKLAAMANASNINLTQSNNDSWLTDSGASDHITANLNNLNQPIPFKGPEQVSVGNGQNLPIQNIGNTQLHTKLHHFRLRNVLHVPRIASNLLSVHKLCLHNNCSCYFDSNKLLVQDLPTGRILYQGQSEHGVYPIHSSSFLKSVHNKSAFNSSLSAANNWLLWHTRLGHPSASVLHSVFPSLKSCNPLNNKSHLLHCQHCLAGKMHKLPFPISVPKSEFPLHVLHADLWGPAPIQSNNGFRFYLVIVDDYTKFCWVYLLKNKSDTFSTFQHFKAMAEKHYNSSIHFLRTDCGGEFTSTAFNSYCAHSGIIHHLTCPHTPQQNGVAERKHRHLIQTTLALLSQSGLSLSHWSYALATACHLINKLPTPLLNMSSPWEQLHHVKPDLSYLRTFGCKCFPLLTPYNTHKLQPKTTPCIFLGYPPTTKGYLCQDPITKRSYTSRHVVFNETEFPACENSAHTPTPDPPSYSPETWLTHLLSTHSCTSLSCSSCPNHSTSVQTSNPTSVINPSPPPANDFLTVPLHVFPQSPALNTALPQSSAPSSAVTPIPIPNSAETPSHVPISAVTPVHAPTPAETPASTPNFAVTPSTAPTSAAPIPPSPLPAPVQNTHPMQTRSKLGIFKPKTCYKAQLDYTLIEPPSFKIATQISQWCQAMQDEYDALIRQGTWSLVPPPRNHNIVGCKWVYKLKTHSDGSLARYKARLVAKGFHQQHGIDFDETFSPVIKPPTVRMILSLAVSLNWPLRQLDVSNAFLHGILKEEVYMSQPQGYINAQHPDYVCRLHKSIYGLKQAPRAWFERFTGQLLQFGFTASAADSSLFIYRSNTIIAYLLLYVDDIVLTSNTPTFLDTLIQHLSSIFELKDLGSLHYFLGIQVTRDSKGLHLSQAKYATALLHKHNMITTKPVSTPCTPNTRLSLHDGEQLQDPHAYRSLVGALHYLTFTRPDLSFAVHQVCQYMASPTSIHLTAAKRILRYLKGTLHLGLSFRPGPLTLSAFTDADWAGDPDDRRSTSGLLVYLGPNPITWSAKKQLTVSRSSTESEYRALALASAEVCWLRTLLKDLGVFISEAPILWCDNISALAIASNPVFHARTKHIEVDFHFVRERVLRKDLTVKFVSTLDQLADIFTKSLPTHRFLDLRSNLMATVRPPELEEGC